MKKKIIRLHPRENILNKMGQNFTHYIFVRNEIQMGRNYEATEAYIIPSVPCEAEPDN